MASIRVTQKMMQEIFDLWNERADLMKEQSSPFKIPRHRTFDSKTKARIKKVLSEYPIDEVKYAITAYTDKLMGDRWYYSYVWTRLEYFMQRGFQKFLPEQSPYDQHIREEDDFLSGGSELTPPGSDPSSFVSFFEVWKQRSREEREQFKQLSAEEQEKMKAAWMGETK